MLELRRVRSFDITKGRVRLDDTARDEVVELEQSSVSNMARSKPRNT